MNDVLIDKEILEDLLEQHISMMGHTSTVAYMAQQALSRPAPASAPVPDVDAVAAKWAAEWETEPGKRRELKKLFVAALKEVTCDD